MRVLNTARKKTDQFSQKDWELMGMHHGQAAFARSMGPTWDSNKRHLRFVYMKCLHAVAMYELPRAEGFEKDYWRTYIITLNLCAFGVDDRYGDGLYLVAEHGKQITNFKTGARYCMRL